MENHSIVLREDNKDVKVGVTLGLALELSIRVGDTVYVEFLNGVKMDVNPTDKSLLDAYKALRKQQMDAMPHEVPIPDEEELISSKQAYTLSTETIDKKTIKYLSVKIKEAALSEAFYVEVSSGISGFVIQKLKDAGYSLYENESKITISW